MPIVHDPHSGKFMPGAHAKGGGGGGGGAGEGAGEGAGDPKSNQADNLSEKANTVNTAKAHAEAARAHTEAAKHFDAKAFDTGDAKYQHAHEYHAKKQQEHIEIARRLAQKDYVKQPTQLDQALTTTPNVSALSTACAIDKTLHPLENVQGYRTVDATKLAPGDVLHTATYTQLSAKPLEGKNIVVHGESVMGSKTEVGTLLPRESRVQIEQVAPLTGKILNEPKFITKKEATLRDFSSIEHTTAKQQLTQLPTFKRELYGQTDVQVHTKDVFGHEMKDVRVPHSLSDQKKFAHAEINLVGLIPTQAGINVGGLDAYINKLTHTSSTQDIPAVARINGKTYIISGHTRLGAQILSGRATANVRLYEWDEKAKGWIKPGKT